MAKAKKSETAQTKETIVENPEVYINPLTDFGFKRIFGEEANKDLLIDFLNAVLKVKGGIKDLQYTNTERKGRIKTDKTTVFDLHCTTGKGERIIVEVQNHAHKNIRERVVYYASRSIQEQGKGGNKWKYNLCPVYSVNIGNFYLDKTDKKDPTSTKYMTYVKLADIETHRVFYDKLTIVYIELPRFKKELEELQDNVERWVYLFRHLPQLDNVPKTLRRNKVFQKLFEQAKIANMTPEEYNEYNQSLKNYRQMNIVVDEYKETIAAKNKTISAMRKKHVQTIAVHINTIAAKDDALQKALARIAELERKAGLNKT